MRTRIAHEVHEGYLRVTLSGQTPGPEARDLLLKIKALSDHFARPRILVDGLQVSAPMSEMERYVLGELGATLFTANQKIAVIYNPDHINKFMENVANNRGAHLLVAGSEAEAIKWLLG